MDVKAAYVCVKRPRTLLPLITLIRMEKGDAKPCVLTSIFESLGNKEIGGELQETIINVTGAAYIGMSRFTVQYFHSLIKSVSTCTAGTDTVRLVAYYHSHAPVK